MCALEYYTYKDYMNWEGRWELINGLPMAMSPAPMRKHQSIASEINYYLREQFDECELCEVLGEIDYKVNEDTVLRPDIVLTCGETHDVYLTKAPEIVFEIISPSTAKRDEKYKFDIYETEKVNYYILVYPTDNRAKIYKHNGERYIKVDDFTNQKYNFDKLDCEAEIDFSEVFERFIK